MDKQNIIIYKSEDSDITVEVNLEKKSVWLTQKQMAELFDKNRKTIGLHISNIYIRRTKGKANYRGFLGSSKRG